MYKIIKNEIFSHILVLLCLKHILQLVEFYSTHSAVMLPILVHSIFSHLHLESSSPGTVYIFPDRSLDETVLQVSVK